MKQSSVIIFRENVSGTKGSLTKAVHNIRSKSLWLLLPVVNLHVAGEIITPAFQG
jgi:hypothetical protein